MRGYARVIFGLNALYQLTAGGIFLVTPAAGIDLYGFDPHEATAAARVAIRALGAVLLVTGGISGLIARNPDADPVLLPLMGALSLLTLVCWGMSLVAGEVTVGQIRLDAAIQVLLLIAVIGYYGTAARGRTSAVR